MKKVYIIISAVLLFLFFAGWYLKNLGDEERKKAQIFSKGKTAENCLSEVLRRYGNKSKLYEPLAKAFLEFCVEATGLNKEFCNNVPAIKLGKISELKTTFLEETAKLLKYCSSLGYETAMCPGLVTEISKRCRNQKQQGGF